MVNPKVSIVIPTYNRKQDVLECLASSQNLDYPNFETIVIDNGCTDGTSEAIEQRFPDVKLVRNDKNLGVTGGRNLGAKYVNGEYIFFLDHDTIVNRQTISELVSVMEKNPRIGAAGPIVFYYHDPTRISALGTSISLLTGRVSFNFTGLVEDCQLNKIVEVQVIPVAILIRRETLDKVGMFDDIFFAVYEDTDFCFRIRENGYQTVCIPRAKIWHKISSDFRNQNVAILDRAYYVARNKVIFMRKHSKYFPAFIMIFLPIYLVYFSLLSVICMKGNWLKNYIKGLVTGLCIAWRLK